MEIILANWVGFRVKNRVLRKCIITKEVNNVYLFSNERESILNPFPLGNMEDF